MTLSFEVNGVAVPTEAVQITGSTVGGVQGLPSSAWYGEPSTATIIVDDPFGDYDFRAWEVFTADESAATGKTRIFTGWIFNVTISRGPLPYRHDVARVWQLDVIDQNACLSFEVFRANSAQRPDETDLARIEFILESAPMAGTPVVAGTLTNLTDNPRNLQSADYVRQYPAEAFTSTAGQSGKSFYVFWNQTEERLELYYDAITAYPAADAAISNLMADEGPGVFYPFLDAELRRAGDSIYTGELLDFVGGTVYARNQATIDRLSPTPLSPINFLRDFMRRSDQIGLLSTANAVVADDLAGHNTEEDTITVTIRVPAANVNDIEAGQKVTVTFSHLVGYETPTEVNCIKRNVVPTEGRVDMYDVLLELSNKAKLRDLDGGDPDVFPPAQVCDVDNVVLVQSNYDYATEVPLPGPFQYTATWDSQPTPGNMLVAGWVVDVNGTPSAISIDGWTFADEAHIVGTGGVAKYVAMFTKVAETGEPTTITIDITGGGFGGQSLFRFQLQEWSGVDTVDAVAIVEDEDGSLGQISTTITPTTDLPYVLIVASSGISGAVSNLGTMPSGIPTLDNEVSGGANRTYNILHRVVEDTTGGYVIGTDRTTGAKGAMVVVALSCSGDDPDAPCIAPGQPSVEDEPATPPTGDGTTTTFATLCPFADNTLHVKVDNLNQDAAVVSYDGAAGTFTLGFAPVAGEQVTTNYLGRP